MDGPDIKLTIMEGGRLPSYATDGAAGMDLYSREDVELQPMERKLVGTGLKMAIPSGFEGQVRPRSGLALKLGLSIVNAPGTIDSDYRGEIGVVLINLGADVVRISKGERIAQLVVCPVVRARLLEVADSDLSGTERGEGGFGSTGIQ